MKIIENKWTHYINGYLSALGDIEGEDLHYICRLISSNNEKLSEKIVFAFDFVDKVEIIKEKIFESNYAHEDFFKQLLLRKPFEMNNIESDILDNYKDYISFHLTDYIDFAFEEIGIIYPFEYSINLALLRTNKENLITIDIKVKDIDFLFVIKGKNFEKKYIDDLYTRMLTY